METGLRILAFVIDIVVVTAVGIAVTLLLMFSGALLPEDAGAVSDALALGWIVMLMVYITVVPFLFYLCPVLYFAGLTAWRGRTLGKMLCRIRVVDENHRKPTFLRAAGRESLKMIAVVTQIGAWIALIQVLLGQSTWYDSVSKTNVESYAGLTATQKNFRKYHGRY
jgi:uncharacterized RDD family membrane protein YckC